MPKVGDNVTIRAVVNGVSADGCTVTVQPVCDDAGKQHDPINFEACYCCCDKPEDSPKTKASK